MPQPDERMPPPVCLALVLSDMIYREPVSLKLMIMGTFSVIKVAKFPATHSTMAMYCVLTDGYGERELTIRIVRVADDDPIIAETKETVVFPDPRTIVEILAEFANVTFSEPGEYAVQVVVGDDILLERRIFVGLMEGESDDQSTDTTGQDD